MAARELRAGLLALSVGASAIRAQSLEKLSVIDVPFVANQGQFDPAVAFSASTLSGTVFVTEAGEIVYSLPGKRENTPGWMLTETFSGGQPRPRSGEGAVTRVSYFLGKDPERWRSGLSTYESVELGEVWPGVDVSLRAQGRRVEKLFTVFPGASADSIRVRIDGTNRLRINESGELTAEVGPGEVTFSEPVAYQHRGELRVPVSVAYRLRGPEYGFHLGAYDPAIPVLIDPVLQSTYLGGSAGDIAYAIAVHPSSGEIFLAGRTESANFPGTTGGSQPNYGGNFDAFAARFNSTLTSLLQATYVGGSAFDYASAIALHPITGEILIAGETQSGNFPGTTGGAQPGLNAFEDAFVVRLDPTLASLHQGTYLGGNCLDSARSMAVDPVTGHVLIAGVTCSTVFPGTAGGAQPTFGGSSTGGDAFAARLNSTLTSLIQSTYLGGNSSDVGFAMTISPVTGEILVAGETLSSDFPGTSGGAQAALGGNADGFIARLNPMLTVLLQATYLGGSLFDHVLGLTVDTSTGHILVAGPSLSTNFPGVFGGAQPAKSGSYDAVVARLNPTLTTLIQATYLGDTFLDEAFAITTNPATGDVFVTGWTDSTNLPGTAGSSQVSSGGGLDAFVARFPGDLTSLTRATYLGGSGGELPWALTLQPASGELIVVGETNSTNFPAAAGGAQASFAGGLNDAFVARLSTDLAGLPTPTPTGPSTDVPTLSPGTLALLAVALATIGFLLTRQRL
jgi:hypothetical protein